MNSTAQLAATAHLVDEGVLSAKLSSILSRPAGTLVSEKDRADMSQGRQLLVDILAGAKMVSSSPSPAAGVTSQSIRSLGLVLSPLEKLQVACAIDAASDAGIIQVLGEMEQALSRIVAAGAVPERSRDIEITQCFFEILADSLLASLNRSQRLSRQVRA